MPRSRRVHPYSTTLRSHYPHITHGLVRRISRDPDFLRRLSTFMRYVHMRNSRSVRQFTTENHRRRIALHILNAHAAGRTHDDYMRHHWSEFESS